MRRYSKYLSGSVLLASLGGVQAKLDLNSTSNIAIYWGGYVLAKVLRKRTHNGQVKIRCKERVASNNSRWLTTARVSEPQAVK